MSGPEHAHEQQAADSEPDPALPPADQPAGRHHRFRLPATFHGLVGKRDSAEGDQGGIAAAALSQCGGNLL